MDIDFSDSRTAHASTARYSQPDKGTLMGPRKCAESGDLNLEVRMDLKVFVIGVAAFGRTQIGFTQTLILRPANSLECILAVAQTENESSWSDGCRAKSRVYELFCAVTNPIRCLHQIV